MTLAEARKHFGMEKASDAAVRAAAEAEGIEIADEQSEAEPKQKTGVEALTEATEQLRAALEKTRTADEEEMSDENQRAVAEAQKLIAQLQGESPVSTPTRQEGRHEPKTAVFDRFDAAGWGRETSGDAPESKERYNQNMRANLELAGMIFEGTRKLNAVSTVEAPEDFERAWKHHLFEAGGPQVFHADSNGDPTRAMDTQESGFGSDLIGAQYVAQLWEAARQRDSLVGRIREIPMTDPTTTVPIDGDLPEMLFVSESTADAATAYSVSDTGSSSVTLTAKKFTIQQIWSGELNEDSIIAFVPFLRDKLNEAAALYLGSSYYNGDTTNAGTGNINLDDANPDDTKHYLAYDGIRHEWLVDDTGQGYNMGNAALDVTQLTKARGKLNAGDDDVDNLIKNINWGLNPRDLMGVLDWDTYINLIDADIVKTVDQYGPQATVLTGELGSLPGGIPFVSPAYASKTEADGKASDTESNNSRGQLSIFAPRGWLAGRRRDTQLFFDRIQRTDQLLFELYTRRAFNQFGTNVASGIYNISVA